MKRLLTLSALAAALFFAQPAQAQQQDNQAENIYQQMEMMSDSTMQSMMKMMMNNPQMRQMMMQSMQGDSTMMSGMMNHMKSDSTMSHGMMDSNMMNMCMKHMMEGDMDKDMHHDMNMHHMQKNKNDDNKMNKNEG